MTQMNMWEGDNAHLKWLGGDHALGFCLMWKLVLGFGVEVNLLAVSYLCRWQRQIERLSNTWFLSIKGYQLLLLSYNIIFLGNSNINSPIEKKNALSLSKPERV